MRSLAPAALTLALFTAPALADVITPVSQNRSVAGSADAVDATDSDFGSASESAPDFAPFSEGAAYTASVFDALGSGGGTQTSTIGGSSIQATGSSFANGEGYSFEGFGGGSGSSIFSVTFDVTSTSSYTLSGYVEAYDNGGASMSLLQDATTLFSEGAFGGPTPINESGTLAPGRYTLNASTSGSASAGGFEFDYASGAFDLDLSLTPTVPEPTLQRVLPARGPFQGGNRVLVTGACFTPGTSVAFDGIPSPAVTFLNANTLQVEVPPHPLPALVQLPSGVVRRLSLTVPVTVSEGSSSDVLPLGYTYGGTLRGGSLQPR